MVLATKAARGAGAPPAQAAQFGAAAVAHLGAEQGIEVLTAALDALPAGPIVALPLDLARLAERAEEGHASGTIENTALAQSYVGTLPYKAQMDAQGMVQIDLNTPAARGAVHRIDLPDAIYSAWSALAARLLVPESEASRLSGAGAGLTDND